MAYQIRNAEPRNLLPEIDLLPEIQHRGSKLDVHLFGPNTYQGNIRDMQKKGFHSSQLPNISFSPATTSESISIASHGFKNFARPKIFNQSWLQEGYIVRAQEGVYANPPKDSQGKTITEEQGPQGLKSFLKKDKKVNGIYLMDNDFGFAPDESFRRGVQDTGDFLEGGLARVLEHTSEKEAEVFGKIASPKFYKRGVDVYGFDEAAQPVLGVLGLYSDRDLDAGRLIVNGSFWYGLNYNGFAFGVLRKTGEASHA